MSWHGEQLKSALGLSALVSFYGITTVLVWFLGSSLGLTVTSQIVIIALILLTWPGAVLIRRYFKAREEPTPAPAPDGRATAPRPRKQTQLPPPTGTYEELTRGAEEAVQWLRGTKLSGKQSGDAVYALPWFMIAGPPASGKTSLLLCSGLDFHALPSQRSSDQNVIRPTRHCEWRVTDSAILLDTSGSYQTEGPGRDEWAALIETIKRHRKTRPLDGFVIAVSTAALLQLSESEIEQQAKILRARLDEAVGRAQVRFPVYLVFTHADLIEGCEEFFHTFNRDERAQVWGTTIPLAQSADAHALFDAEFDRLYGRLVRRRAVQLGATASPAKQLRIFKFPGRFRRTRNRLGLFTSALFRPNPFSESPLLRGFYFTSSGGDGVAHVPGGEYFTHDLFKEVVLRDKNIAASMQAKKQNPQRLRFGLLAAAALLLLIFSAGMIVSFRGNNELITDALRRGEAVNDIKKITSKNPQDPEAARKELAAVERLRETLHELDRYERNSPPLSLRFGLYSGNKLNASDRSNLRHIYFDAVEQRFLKPTVARLKDDLRSFVSGQKAVTNSGTAVRAQATSPEEEHLGRHYDLLKAYLMFVNPDKVEPVFLANQLRDYWKTFAPPGKEEEEDAIKQLEFYAGQAGRADAPHQEVDATLVADARSKLRDYPIVNRVYKRLVSKINGEVKTTVNLTTIAGAREGNVLSGAHSVPGAFTLDGYRMMRETLESSAQEEFRKDDWVMNANEAATQNPDEMRNKSAGMLELFEREYIAEWQKFLQEVKVRDYEKGKKEDAVKVLRLLAGSTSPLESVMREVARQTDVSTSGDGFFNRVKTFFANKTSAGSQTQIEKEFRPLIKFVEGKEDASPMAEYRTKLKNVADQLNASNKPLSEISKALQSGTDLIKLGAVRREIDDTLEAKDFGTTPASDAASKLLKQPLNNLNTLLVGTDFEQIEKVWQQLSAKAQALETGFPFKDGGSGDASVAKLAQFINPQDGELTRFFNERLKPYFEEDWSVKKDASEKFSPDFVNYLTNVRRLRDALFPSGGKEPKVEYQIVLTPVKDAITKIESDGNKVLSPDKPSAMFTWPGDKSGARITVTPSTGQDQSKPFAGEWGLVHMFREGGGGDGKAPQFNLGWDVGAPVRASVQPKSGNIFQRDLFTALHAPKTLIQSR